MSLMYRLKRLAKADAHALVEGLEEPRWILAQAIRDMECELEKDVQALSQRRELLDETRRDIQDIERALQSGEADIALALEEKREDIVKQLIRKSILAKRTLKAKKAQERDLDKECTTRQADVDKKKQAYDEVMSKSLTVRFDKGMPDAFAEAQALVAHGDDLNHEVELEFLRRLREQRGKK
jgi:phage shock protein A